MSRCVLVLGTGRSGTSVVAGVLHKLGVHMGNVFQPANRNNRYGTFECAEFRSLDVMVAYDTWMSDESARNAYARLVDKRKNGHDVWGVKDPDLVRTLHHVIPNLDDYRIVVCKRDKAATVASYIKAYHTTEEKAAAWYDDSIAHQERQLAALDCPVIEVEFDDLLKDPQAHVKLLHDFAFDGLSISQNGAYERALAHIKPRKKIGIGWGDICIGVRMYKVPEMEFFSSWTAMLTNNGLGERDTVLLPESQMTGHRAANKIAHAFMRTDCDSLLLLDDDMVFEGDTLRRLRDNTDNWNYDVVMAFATHRTWPPKPVIMRLLEEQPEDAQAVGNYYQVVYDWIDGMVEPVDAVGLAFTLIRRKVFDAMTDPRWGMDKTDYFCGGIGSQGPDIPFSNRCRELGFKLAIDTSVKVGHVGRFIMGYEQYLNWQAGLEK